MDILGNLETGIKRKAIAKAATAASIVAFACLICMLINGHLAPPEKTFPLSAALATVGTIATVAVFLFFFVASKSSARQVAIKMDREHNAKNRLEAAVELADSDNPAKHAQKENTEEFYSGEKIAISLIWPLSAILLVLALLLLDGNVLIAHYRYTSAAKRKAAMAAQSPTGLNNKKDGESHETAQLALTIPTEDIQAKPMDDISWEGIAQSPRPFDKLQLSIYVNGSLKKELTIPNSAVTRITDADLQEEAPESSKKQTAFSLKGDFFLDDLNVVPFDVVSYHLTGYCTLNGKKNTEIISIPKFIEVRPFREDAYHLKGKGGAMLGGMKIEDIVAIINKLMRFQLALNKALFALRINSASIDHKILRDQLAMLGKDQKQLEKETASLLAKISPESISANMLNQLTKARNDMRAAATKLRLSVAEWEKQQKRSNNNEL